MQSIPRPDSGQQVLKRSIDYVDCIRVRTHSRYWNHPTITKKVAKLCATATWHLSHWGTYYYLTITQPTEKCIRYLQQLDGVELFYTEIARDYVDRSGDLLEAFRKHCVVPPNLVPATTNQCISAELAYSGKRRLLTRSTRGGDGYFGGVAAPGVAAALFGRGKGAVAGRLTNRGDDAVLLTSSPRPEQGMGGNEYFLPDTQAFGSGQRIRSSHSLQEIRPGLVEELGSDGESSAR
jgi:hypothetical protein